MLKFESFNQFKQPDQEEMKKFKIRSRSCGLKLERLEKNNPEKLMTSAPLVITGFEKDHNNARKRKMKQENKNKEKKEKKNIQFSKEEERKLFLFDEISLGDHKLTVSPHLISQPSTFTKKEVVHKVKEEFQEICKETPFLTNSMNFHQKREMFPSSCCSENWSKNRYTDVLCTEKTRVVLRKNNSGNMFDFSHISLSLCFNSDNSSNSANSFNSPESHSPNEIHRESDFINANFTRCSPHSSLYVATQAPISSTICDFFEMIWQLNSKVIVCLSSVFEGGRKKMDEYWPEEEDNILQFNNFSVKLLKKEIKEGFFIRSLCLSNQSTEESREIVQFHFSEWPDCGVPNSPSHFLSLVSQVSLYNDSGNSKTQNGPIVCHCSAGIGRSAVYISIASSIELIESLRKNKNDESSESGSGEVSRNLLNNMIDVKQFVLKLRKQRHGMIQTPKQYSFIYKAINLYLSINPLNLTK